MKNDSMQVDENKNHYYKSILRILMRRNTILAGLFAGTIGGSLYMNYGSVKYFWAPKKRDLQFEETPQYIDIPIAQESLATDYISTDVNGHDYSIWTWWKPQPITNKQIHWKLLKLSHSKDKRIRHLALTGLVELPGLNDAEYREIAQALNFKTSLELGKTQGVDQRFFLPPPKIPTELCKHDLSTMLKVLLNSLPKEKQEDCAKFFTDKALGIIYNEEEGGIWRIWGDNAASEGESGVGYPKRVPEQTAICLSLQALLHHSAIPDHRAQIVRDGGLQLMERAIKETENGKDTAQVCGLIGKTIGNLALTTELRHKIFSSGWIGILSKWFNSNNFELSIIAGRALSNLSAADYNDPVYEDGIYLLHPVIRQWDPGYDVDIVFVHGLLGGVFRTWRQQDSRKIPSSRNTTAESFISAIQSKFSPSYTNCWPKDWLPKDLRRIRILAVDYDSNLSDWRTRCPLRGKMNTLAARSKDMLERLSEAKIGSKPVVFVTHSLGGLIVKEMLLQSQKSLDKDQRNISENTRGTVFYSVPHRGSPLADLKPSVEFLVKPSIEVQELKDKQRLQALHKNFLELAHKKSYACLSFGETKKTNLGLKWNVLVVPPELADPGIGKFYTLPVNHLNTCKPYDNSSSNYVLLAEFLREIMENAASQSQDQPPCIKLETERILLTHHL